jgi:hypothetical protein
MLYKLPEEVQKNLAASIPFSKRRGSAQEFTDRALPGVQNLSLNGAVLRRDGI